MIKTDCFYNQVYGVEDIFVGYIDETKNILKNEILKVTYYTLDHLTI